MRVRLAVAALAAMALAAAPAQGVTTGGGHSLDVGHADPGEVVNGEKVDLLSSRRDIQAVLLSANGVQAVGQLVQNNVSHEILLDRNRLVDFSSQLGPGNFVSIDGVGDIAGANGRPLFFHPGATALTLPFPGQANAVGLGPFVGFTTRDQAGNPAAGVWNPKTGGLAPLGAAQIGGVNAMHTVVGRTANGDAWYARVISSNDFETHDLGWQGFLTRVNAFDFAVGNKLVAGGPKPIGVNVDTGAVTTYKLPAGFKFGSITGISDTNIAVGNLFRNAADLQANNAVGVAYTNPHHPMPFKALHIQHLPHTTFLDFNAISPAGVEITGILPEGAQADVPFLLTPGQKFKLFGIGSIREKWASKKDQGQFLSEANAIERDLALGRRKRACTSLRRLDLGLNVEADFLEGYLGAFAARDVQLYDDLSDGLSELATELRCPMTFRTLDLSMQQYRGL